MAGTFPYTTYMELDDRLRHKVDEYTPSAEVLAPIRDTPLLFLVGITGAGKNTTLDHLLRDYPDQYHFIVSHTTRAPRENHGVMEEDGKQYHFISPADVYEMLDAGAFIEVQPVHTSVYGTSVQEVLLAKQQNKIAITDMDIQGVDYCMGLGLNAKSVFMLPPNYDIWFERFKARYGGRVHHHDLAVRLQSAVKEIEHALQTDYFYILINDDIDEAVELVNDIAHGKPVDPHYHKAMVVAEALLARIKAELSEML
jgi:guanylate kinase